MRVPALLVILLRLAPAGVAALGVASCGSDPPQRAVSPALTIQRDVPAVLDGTIGAQAVIQGAEPTLVSGFGLAVNLNGTGDTIIPEAIAAHLEREMLLMGVGRGARGSVFDGTALEGKTPREVLEDPNTAVVIVRAAIPPGAPEGAEFDVEVRPVATSSATSLEGGQLWTTRLQLGPATVFGQRQTRIVAEAHGPVFTNPFADSESSGGRVGRVLSGGVVTEPLRMLVVLDTQSHSRARAVVSAINSRFPPGPGDAEPTARGLGGRGQGDLMSIALRVPHAYRDRPAEFLSLVRHLQVDPSFPEEYARRYAAAMIEQPWLSDRLGWALQAVGEKALPFVRELYDYPELAPREAAIRTGAHLGDPQVAEPLIRMAQSGPPGKRAQAARLLSRVDGGPGVDAALRELASSGALDVRIAAYESLAERAERAQVVRILEQSGIRRGMESYTAMYPRVERLARLEFRGSALRGVRRVPIGYEPGDRSAKFVLDVVPFGDPLVYVVQNGRPRIALLGEDLTLNKPMLVTAWDNRLMLVSDSAGAPIRVLYRHPRAPGALTHALEEDDLVGLVHFLARDPSPEEPTPGLGFSYAEVVGALSAIQEAGAVDAAFATEQDRLFAELLKAQQAGRLRDRPENEEDETRWEELEPEEIRELMERRREPGEGEEEESLVVPLDPSGGKEPGGADGG